MMCDILRTWRFKPLHRIHTIQTESIETENYLYIFVCIFRSEQREIQMKSGRMVPASLLQTEMSENLFHFQLLLQKNKQQHHLIILLGLFSATVLRLIYLNKSNKISSQRLFSACQTFDGVFGNACVPVYNTIACDLVNLDMHRQ